MFLLAAVLTASINIDIDLTSLIHRARQAEPKATCGINTVGYRFRGTPGQQFEYAGDRYEIPAEGWVELIADRGRTTYEYNNEKLPLGANERDPFGFRDVTLPAASMIEKGDSK
ncbi:MAG: hypothetical protein M3Q69_15120 [Acidobacteriota bacterium]|nr:hypothetical protein [Acidobacteriota bacterium]